MQNRRGLRGYLSVLFITITAVMLVLLVWSCAKDQTGDTIQQAYDLRMNGRADSALVLLEKRLAADSTDAEVWFELARTKHHLGLGDPSKLFGMMDELQHAVDTSVELAPDNVTYAFYRSYVSFFRSYAALMMNLPDAADRVGTAISAYEAVLKIKPDYHEALLNLVEILGLPPEIGGDSTKAETYAAQLEEMDVVRGAQARELRLPQDADRVVFWQEVVDGHPDNAIALEQLGKAHLYSEHPEQGIEFIERAMKLVPNGQLMLLDLARYFAMTGMQDSTKMDTDLPRAGDFVQQYLDTDPAAPLKAFAVELSARVKYGMGDEQAANTLHEQAMEIDPFFSKAFGVPPLVLFSKPDEVLHNHSYFFRPF